MLLDWIENLGLLSQDPESNVLLCFPAPVRKVLIGEVVGHLYQSCTVAGMSGTLSSTASTPTVLTGSIAAASTGSSVPYAVSAMTPPSEPGLGSLSTLFHVRWTMEILAQAFNLPLEDISIISNAASVYIQWLVDPSKRPLAILRADEETQQQFIQTIFRHISLLFQQKKIEGVGAAKPLLATLASKHVEVCKLMLKTTSQVALASGARIPSVEGSIKMSTATWKLLLRVLLGITDYLLRMPTQPYCYLAEELGEALLSNLLELWLQSQIFSVRLWKALKSCYPTWTHRLLAISHWSAVSLALTQRVTRILYGQGTHAVVYTVHSSLVTLDLSDRYAVYAWYQFVHLIGSPSQSQPSLFFRSVLGMEKLVQVFHSIGTAAGSSGSGSGPVGGASGGSVGVEANVAVERHFPDGNTILHLFGSWLFEAVSRSGPDCVEGRAQAFGVLCRIFARPQLRTPFLATYLHQFYAAVIDGLRGDLMSLVFIVVNCEDIFALGLPGVRILAAPFVVALRRIIPELEKPLRVSLNLDDLRRACYKLLCTIHGCCDHFALAPLKGLASMLPESEGLLGDLSELPVASVDGQQKRGAGRTGSNQSVTDVHFFLEQVRIAYRAVLGSLSLAREDATLGHLRCAIMELLVASFCNEKDPGNQRYLINSLTAFVIDEARQVPALAAVIIGLFEDHLVSGRMSVDVCLVAAEALRQFSSAIFVPALLAHRPDCIRRLLLSLCSVASSLISRNNLPLFLKPIMALYDCVLDWILGAADFSSSLAWFANDIECQSAFIQVLDKGLSFGVSSAGLSMPGAAGKRGEPAGESPAAASASKKGAGPLTPGGSSPSGLGTPTSMTLAITSKSLEAQLVMASEIALARLVSLYALGTSNPFAPVHLSAMANEALLLKGADHPVNYQAGHPRRLADLSREQLSSLRYFVLNGNTIVCFLEKPTEPDMPHEQSAELVALIRSVSGRLAWEDALVYRPGGAGLNMAVVETLIDRDPTSMEPVANIPGEHQVYAPMNVLADSYEQQKALVQLHEELQELPVQVDAMGPLFNEDMAIGRFAADDKRLINYNCIDSLARQQVGRTFAGLINEGMSLCNYRARPTPKASPEGQLARIMIAHFGLASLRCRDSIVRLPPCVELLGDLEILDSLPERETISCSVLFIRSGRQGLEEILGERSISGDFGSFVKSLGWSVDLALHSGWMGNYKEDFAKTAPYYADVDVEVIYHLPQLIDATAYAHSGSSSSSAGQPVPSPPPAHHHHHHQHEDGPSTLMDMLRFISNDLVCILWIEDLQEMLTLPSKFQTRAIVYICISPLPDGPSSAGLYRIRIMVTSLANAMVPSSPQSSAPAGDAVFLFGPLLDGMIVRREALGRLVRDTAISASLFCLYSIQNQPRPLAKRAQFIQHMINKYRMMTPTPSKYYNELIYNAGP